MMQKPLDSRKPSPRPIEKKPKGLEQSWFADFLLLGVFLGVIFLGLATYWFGQDREVSVLEGRQLAQQPDVSVSAVRDGSYMEEFESYSSDQVFQRDRWMGLQAGFQKNVFQQKINNGVLALDNGVLIGPDEPVRGFDNMKRLFPEFGATMQEQDVPVYFASAPSKPVHAAQNEMIPDYVISGDLESRGNLHDAVEGADFELIDLGETLFEQPMEDIYFYNDHHWNVQGAFLGYQQIIERLQQDYEDVPKLEASDMETFKIEQPYYGSYAREISLPYVEKLDYLEWMEPKDGFTTEVCRNGDDCGHSVIAREEAEETNRFADFYKVFMKDNYAQLRIEQKDPVNDLHVLVLKDSYANPVLGFLGESFGTVSAIDVRYAEGKVDITDYVEENDVDLVLFMHNDRISGMSGDYEDSF